MTHTAPDTRTTGASTDNTEIDHIVCDLHPSDRTLCGLTGRAPEPWCPDDCTHPLCVVCADIEDEPCPECGR